MDDAWAVLSPDGTLTWYLLADTPQVEAIVSGEYAPGALDGAFVTGPVRCGATSPVLYSNNVRKRWHKQHKAEVRARMAGESR
jgi:hypothetical protein